MNPDAKLAEVVTALEAVGISSLVMGGHAVRYYGLERLTDDLDLHLAPDCCDDLADRLARSGWFRAQGMRELPSWRGGAFRRFQIGVHPTGREIWLEFWNSKETEREKVWLDIQYLEEFQDARLVAAATAGQVPRTAALARLRSRRGLENHVRAGNFADASMVADALAQTANPITVALLLPSAPTALLPAVPIEPVIESRLRASEAGSPLHLTLVEAVRRRYKQDAMETDKADKQAVRKRLIAEDSREVRPKGGLPCRT